MPSPISSANLKFGHINLGAGLVADPTTDPLALSWSAATGNSIDPFTINGDGSTIALQSTYTDPFGAVNPWVVVMGSGGEDSIISAGPSASSFGFEVLVVPSGVGTVDYSQAASLNPTTGNGPGIYVNLGLGDAGLGPVINFNSSNYDPSIAIGGAGFAGVINQSAGTVTPFSYLYGMSNVVATNGSDYIIGDQLADTFFYTGAAGPNNFDVYIGGSIVPVGGGPAINEVNTADFSLYSGFTGGVATAGQGYFGSGNVKYGVYVDLTNSDTIGVTSKSQTQADAFGDQVSVQAWALDGSGRVGAAMAHLQTIDDINAAPGNNWLIGNGGDNSFTYIGFDGITRTAFDPVTGTGGVPTSSTPGTNAVFGFDIYNGGGDAKLTDANDVLLVDNTVGADHTPGAYTAANIAAALAAGSPVGNGGDSADFSGLGSYQAAVNYATYQGVTVQVMPHAATGIYIDLSTETGVSVPDPLGTGNVTVNGSLVSLLEGGHVSTDSIALLQWTTHHDAEGNLVSGTSVAGIGGTAGTDVVYGDNQDNSYAYTGDGSQAPSYFDGWGRAATLANPNGIAGVLDAGGHIIFNPALTTPNSNDAIDFSEYSPRSSATLTVVPGVSIDLTQTYASFTDAVGQAHSNVFEAFSIGNPTTGTGAPVLLAAFKHVEHITGSGYNDFLQGGFQDKGTGSNTFEGLDGNDVFAFTQLVKNSGATAQYYSDNLNAGFANSNKADPSGANAAGWHADFGNATIIDFDATTSQNDKLLLNHLDWMSDSGFAAIANGSLRGAARTTAEATYILNNYASLDANGNVVISASTGGTSTVHHSDAANTITLQNVDLTQDLKPHASTDFAFV